MTDSLRRNSCASFVWILFFSWHLFKVVWTKNYSFCPTYPWDQVDAQKLYYKVDQNVGPIIDFVCVSLILEYIEPYLFLVQYHGMIFTYCGLDCHWTRSCFSFMILAVSVRIYHHIPYINHRNLNRLSRLRNRQGIDWGVPPHQPAWVCSFADCRKSRL
jgi:hypothetical protein